MIAQGREIELDCRFTRAQRLLTAEDYRQIFTGAEFRASHRHVLLLARQTPGPRHRMGLVVAKKQVRLAVQRNRVKRFAREMFRQQPQQAPFLDVVIIARSGIDRLDDGHLASVLLSQWRKLVQRAHTATTGASLQEH